MSPDSSDRPFSSEASRRIDADSLASGLSGLTLGISSERAGSVAKIFVVRVAAAHSLEALTRLRDDESLAMRRLVDLSVVDRLGRAPEPETRFVVSYQLHSPTNQQRVRVEVPVGGDDPALDSVVKLWPAANWLEREAFDLFGIRFRGHPELRRILLDDSFEGAPLRKDHPLKLERPLPGSPESSCGPGFARDARKEEEGVS